MSEETKVIDTNPAAKGTSTSEFKVAIAVAIAGGLIGGIQSAVLIAQEAFPGAWWVPLVVGLSTMLGAAWSYVQSRAKVKSAIIQSGTQVVIAEEARRHLSQVNAVKSLTSEAAVNPTSRP